jgi:hypothetical protein
MNHADDEALRQRLVNENLARTRQRAERDSNPIPITRQPREVPRPEPLWLQRDVPTHSAYVDELARRRGRWWMVLAGAAAIGVGALVRWILGGAL